MNKTTLRGLIQCYFENRAPEPFRSIDAAVVAGLADWLTADPRSLFEAVPTAASVPTEKLHWLHSGPEPPPSFAEVSAAVVGSSRRAFALLDADGRILRANSRMAELLAVPQPVGANLLDYFPVASEGVDELCRHRGPRGLQRCTFRRPGEINEVLVTGEFGELTIAGRTYSVAVITDVGAFVATDLEFFDRARFGIILTDPSQDSIVRYCNPCGAELLGREVEELQGRNWSVNEIFDESRNQRHALQADDECVHYPLTLPATESRPETPIEVFAFPDNDPVSGKRIGNIFVFRSALKTAIRDRLHHLIADLSARPHFLASQGILTIGKIIPHDFAVVTLFFDGKWCWPAHLEPRPGDTWPTRWYLLPDGVLDWMSKQYEARGGILVDDMRTMFNEIEDAEELANDEVMVRLIDEGHRGILSLPVRNEEQSWLASLSLFRRGENAFTEEELETAREIDCVGFVQAIHRAFERREDRLLAEVRETVRATGSLKEACDAIARRLSEYFRWQHLAFFACDYENKEFHLIAQANYDSDLLFLPDDFRQGFSEGLLGECLKRRKVVVINDSGDGSHEAQNFVRNHPKTQSALCIPITIGNLLSDDDFVWGRRPVCVINVEDSRKWSFPPQTVDTLSLFVKELEKTLASKQRDSILATMQKEFRSALLLVDRHGIIWGINGKAKQLLGLYDGEDAELAALSKIFVDRSDLISALQPMHVSSLPVTIRQANHKASAALLFTADLPAPGRSREAEKDESRTGLRLIHLTDLEALQWQHDLTAIKAAVAAVADEMKPKLIKAFSMLDELKEGVFAAPSVEENLAKARRCIDQLENELDDLEFTSSRIIQRLSQQEPDKPRKDQDLIDVNEILIAALDYAAGRTRTDLRSSLAKPLGAVQVRMDSSRLRFLFDTILDYMIRRKAVGRDLRTRVECRKPFVTIEFSAPLGEMWLGGSDSMTRAGRLGRQLVSLNEDRLREIVEAHDGTLKHWIGRGRRSHFKLTLPLVDVPSATGV